MKDTFPVVRCYYGLVTTFQMPWGFILASKKHDPLSLDLSSIAARLSSRGVTNRYATPRFMPSMFVLPEYMLRAIEEHGKVLTDSEPFLWTA